MNASDVYAQLKTLGEDFTPAQIQGTQALFAPLVPRPNDALCRVLRDVPYGPDARHRLDIFTPVASASRPRPVFVFVHGGGFVQGDKGGPDAPYYNNVGCWAAAQGYVGVTLTYRLAPAHPWPAGAQDLDAALAWLSTGIGASGGDPAAIVLAGQSAGAAHVAGCLARHGLAAGTQAGVAAAVLVSGIYDIVHADRNPFQAAYYGTDAARFESQSSLAALAATSIPCLFAVCEYDPVDFQRQAAGVVAATFAQRSRWPRFAYLAGHNHLSSVLQLGTVADNLGPQIAAFIAQHVGEKR
ncbi:MAG: alpha/beta hydrolase [Pseudomonadota bacterium]